MNECYTGGGNSLSVNFLPDSTLLRSVMFACNADNAPRYRIGDKSLKPSTVQSEVTDFIEIYLM